MNVRKSLGKALAIIVVVLTTAYPVAAQGPPESENEPDDFTSISVQAGTVIIDPDRGTIIRAEVAEQPNPTGPILTVPVAEPQPSPVPSDQPPPVSVQAGQSAGKKMIAIPAGSVLPSPAAAAGLGGQSVGSATSTIIMAEDFEGAPFPTTGWANTGTTQWRAAACLPVDTDLGGSRSGWPAVDVVNPCSSNNYPNNANSLAVFGPFSLADAQSAFLEYFLRMDIQSCNPITSCDYFFVGVSEDGVNFTANFFAGTSTNSGIWSNGYSYMNLDLGRVADGTGSFKDFTGKSQVYLGFGFVSNGSVTGTGPFIDFMNLRKSTDRRFFLIDETFDLADFPLPDWESFTFSVPISTPFGSFNSSYYRWDNVGGSFLSPNCPPRSGVWSLWPADVVGFPFVDRDPCAGDAYANSMETWVIYGPFNLTGANEAWVEFYFRNVSQAGVDTLFWGASNDNKTFYGQQISGSQVDGPWQNDYNLIRFSLSNVGLVGGGSLDYRGEPQMWFAFRFKSDGSSTHQGPFIDDVRIVVEKTVVDTEFVPLAAKSPNDKTSLYIINETGSAIPSYVVNGTPQGNIACPANMAPNVTYFCGTFDSGSYVVNVTALECQSNSAEIFFPSGTVTRRVSCRN